MAATGLDYWEGEATGPLAGVAEYTLLYYPLNLDGPVNPGWAIRGGAAARR